MVGVPAVGVLEELFEGGEVDVLEEAAEVEVWGHDELGEFALPGVEVVVGKGGNVHFVIFSMGVILKGIIRNISK